MNEENGKTIKISLGNSKIGNVPNLSLPPIITCRAEAPCAGNCYAAKCYNRWSSVKNAWDHNFALYEEDRESFFRQLHHWLRMNEPRRFRFFVGGDFPDRLFMRRIFKVIKDNRNISFLAFTKQYEMVDNLYSEIPSNLNLILSMWPDLEVPDLVNYLPSAWLTTDDRFDKYFTTYISCKENCAECMYSCWSAVSPNLPVKFNLH